jgi:hypothetical protein
LLQRLQPNDKSFLGISVGGRKIPFVKSYPQSKVISPRSIALHCSSAGILLCLLSLTTSLVSAQATAPLRFSPQAAPEDGPRRLNFDERRALRQEIRSHGLPSAQSLVPASGGVAVEVQPSPTPAMSDVDRQQLRNQIREQRKLMAESRRADVRKSSYSSQIPTPTEVER